MIISYLEVITQIPENYKGREQALIKHSLLKTYLERLFMIIGQHQQRICYVDCFAGPWQEGSSDLKDTSIAISLDIMRKCRDGLLGMGHDVQFRALFIEKDKRAFVKLESFLSGQTHSTIQTKPFNGEFFDLREDILKLCGADDFAFFFIDPKGWRHSVEIPTLRPLLQRRNSEYLINFMFDFLLRAHTQEAYKEHMMEIFGEVPNTDRMTPKEREICLLKMYRDHLKKAQPVIGGIPRSAYVKVLDPYKDRTKYDLVYLTRHPKGIKVFMEASEKLELVQKTVRAQAKQDRRIEQTGQGELFAAATQVKNDDERVELSTVKGYWLKKLSPEPKRFGIVELADMLEETGWFITDFQNAFRELEKDGKVKNLDAIKSRPVNAVNFEKGENLKRI